MKPTSLFAALVVVVSFGSSAQAQFYYPPVPLGTYAVQPVADLSQRVAAYGLYGGQGLSAIQPVPVTPVPVSYAAFSGPPVNYVPYANYLPYSFYSPAVGYSYSSYTVPSSYPTYTSAPVFIASGPGVFIR